MRFSVRSVAALAVAAAGVVSFVGWRGAPLLRGAEVDAESLDFAAFGFGLFQRLAAAAPEENVILSPVSAGLALSMLANGADGETLDGILRTLAVGDGLGSLNRSSAALLEALRSEDLELGVANAIWARQGVPILPAFVDGVAGPYAAEVATVDFDAPGAAEEINAWASRSTRGRISKIVSSPLHEALVLLLANAVYFKGRWLDEFLPAATRDRPFHAPGGAVQHPLMHRTADFGYRRGDGFAAVRLPYRGERFAMYVLLPDSGVALGAVRGMLTAEAWDGWMRGFEVQPVELALPRFRLNVGAGLVGPLAEMGMADSFDPDRARFTRIVAGGRVFVSDAVQQVFIEVNEEGTEAAAVTVVSIIVDSVPPPPVPFIVDRPFLFAIRDDLTGALLFVGQVVDPAG